jgi:hypothetical protein
MVDLRLKDLVEDVDRHGNVRIYFRRKGHAKIRLKGLPGSAEFKTAYAKALEITLSGAAPVLVDGRNQTAIVWHCNQYFRSARYTKAASQGANKHHKYALPRPSSVALLA